MKKGTIYRIAHKDEPHIIWLIPSGNTKTYINLYEDPFDLDVMYSSKEDAQKIVDSAWSVEELEWVSGYKNFPKVGISF